MPNTSPASSITFQKDRLSPAYELIEGFISFCGTIDGAVEELRKITTEHNRIQLQKLVFVHLVNNFDSVIDKLLLWSATNNKDIRDKVLASVKDEPVYLKNLYEVFLESESPQEVIIQKMEDKARISLLNKGHAEKVRMLALSVAWKQVNTTFVATSGPKTGRIATTKAGRKAKKVPNSVPGFSDYLYSKRNSIVHGNGIRYTEKDFKRLKEDHCEKLPQDFKLSIGSITTAQTFYKSFAEIYLEKIKRAA